MAANELHGRVEISGLLTQDWTSEDGVVAIVGADIDLDLNETEDI